MSAADIETSAARPGAGAAAGGTDRAAAKTRKVIVVKENAHLENAASAPGEDDAATILDWDALGGARAAIAAIRSERPSFVELRVPDLALVKRPLAHKLLLLAAAPRARRALTDAFGAAEPASLARIALADAPRAALGLAAVPILLLRLWFALRRLDKPAPTPTRSGAGPVLMLRPHFFHARFGGTLAHLHGVLGGLRAVGRSVALLATDRPEGVRAEPGWLSVRHAPPPRLFADFPQLQELAANLSTIRAARRAMTGAPPALIYQRHQGASLFGLWLARAWRRPLVLEFNSSDAAREAIWGERRSRLGGVKRRIERTVLRRADLVVAVSEALKAQAAALGAAPERILVQPNGVDVARFAPRPADPAWRARLTSGGEAAEGDVLVGFLGSLTAYMGLDVLLRAAQIARSRGGAGARLRVAIIGDGGARPGLEAQAADARALAGRIVFTGAIPFEAAPEALAAFDVAVCPHDPPIADEDFYWSPIKLFEYMAAGKPVVASRVGQMADILRDGETGLLVERGDADALADALERLAAGAELRAQLGAAARAQAVARHGWDAAAARILAAAGAAETEAPA